jgi:hypothetical protein
LISHTSLPHNPIHRTRRNRKVLALIAQIILEHTPVAIVAPAVSAATCITSRRQEATNWSVLMLEDGFGFGYVAQPSSENNTAMREGWVLISADLTLTEACEMRDGLRSGEVIIEDLAA